ncbi:MAG TPA: zinc ribbon domain-containing protein [Verrucomicrobiae bacterium]|nr:zinc ribbon domain-containing protein [Verrucomicrobiae bacterium]
MIAASDPYQIIGGLGIAFLLLAGLWRLIAWVREAPVKPDPWDAEVEQKLSDPETAEVCPHCSTPQPPTAWFCRHCGKAVGPYNNLMPFVNVFSEGEVLRNGTSGRFRNRPLILAGYLLISLGINPFIAPIYLFFLLSNRNRPPAERESTEGQNVP